jgi:hypothetical protein
MDEEAKTLRSSLVPDKKLFYSFSLLEKKEGLIKVAVLLVPNQAIAHAQVQFPFTNFILKLFISLLNSQVKEQLSKNCVIFCRRKFLDFFC